MEVVKDQRQRAELRRGGNGHHLHQPVEYGVVHMNEIVQGFLKRENTGHGEKRQFKSNVEQQPRPCGQQNEGGCESKITLKPEGSGVKTGVRLENGKIFAPLAFTGSKYLFGNCFEFSGWAQANLKLNFDEAQQTVFGQIEVETVNLDGITPVIGGIITPFVQSSLNQRVNPITILRGQQIALSLPIAATEGTLNARVKDVRSEIKDNALNLFITYDFTGTKGLPAAQ